MSTRTPSTRLPRGFAVGLGSDVRLSGDRRLLLGGMPARVLHLRAEAADLLTDEPLVVDGPRSAALARMLLDRGLAHPVPCPVDRRREVTVVVPVRDRPEQLDRLLGSLPSVHEVVVVDDASSDPAAVASVVWSHGARLVCSPVNVGPAGARNLGLREVRTPVVALVDSDVDASGPWLDVLLGHLDDPRVALVAPRVLGREGAPHGWIGRYEAVRSSLDLGPTPALVRPGGGVSYVPSACVVARTAALGRGFDPTMQVAEDVDLVWRLSAEGHLVRYEPTAAVRHDHRVATREWWRRKAFYGTGAAELAARHGDAVAPAVVAPWAAAAVGAMAAQRWWSVPVAATVSAVAGRRLAGRLPGADDPTRAAVTLVGSGLVATAWQAGGMLTRHAWPLAALGALGSRRVRRLVLLAAVTEGVADRRRAVRDHPGVAGTGPLAAVQHVVAHRLDDLAYGAGVWRGCLRARSVRALVPRLVRR